MSAKKVAIFIGIFMLLPLVGIFAIAPYAISLLPKPVASDVKRIDLKQLYHDATVDDTTRAEELIGTTFTRSTKFCLSARSRKPNQLSGARTTLKDNSSIITWDRGVTR